MPFMCSKLTAVVLITLRAS